jgi:hypothetical protein
LEAQPDLRAGGEKVVRSGAFEWLSRAGFVARGIVYVTVGVLAIKLAVGSGGRNANQIGALRAIAGQPFGKVLLVLIAVGLGGYALWRLFRAALGHGPEGSDDAIDRVAAFASGIVYAGLCVIAVEVLRGGGGSGSAHKPTAGILGWPGGTWLVGIAGVVFAGVGLYQGYRGISTEFLDESKSEEMSPRVRAAITWLGIFGYLARMVVFTLVGIFLVRAAVDYDPKKAVGLDGALAAIDHASYGPYLLGIVATGLIAFGAYSLSDARYRRL